VVIELREASRARIDMLAAALEQTIRNVPADDDQFDFAVSSGQNPRFFIDATAHVHLGRDRMTYRFVRDGRNGRILLAESRDLKVIADRVTRYVAERIVERQRMLDGSVTDLANPSRITEQALSQNGPAAADAAVRGTQSAGSGAQTADTSSTIPVATGPGDFMLGLIWFIIGTVAGAALLYAWLTGALASVSGG
jgi:hypothetical protein